MKKGLSSKSKTAKVARTAHDNDGLNGQVEGDLKGV